MKTIGIRGAITVDENSESAICDATVELLQTMIDNNDLYKDDIAYIQFSATKDLNRAYPAKYVRTKMGITDIPMVCYQEMDVEGSLRMCIRLLIVINTINNDFKAKHVYLKEARKLRPDI